MQATARNLFIGFHIRSGRRARVPILFQLAETTASFPATTLALTVGKSVERSERRLGVVAIDGIQRIVRVDLVDRVKRIVWVVSVNRIRGIPRIDAVDGAKKQNA